MLNSAKGVTWRRKILAWLKANNRISEVSRKAGVDRSFVRKSLARESWTWGTAGHRLAAVLGRMGALPRGWLLPRQRACNDHVGRRVRAAIEQCEVTPTKRRRIRRACPLKAQRAYALHAQGRITVNDASVLLGISTRCVERYFARRRNEDVLSK